MEHENGHILLHALQDLGKPATINQIVDCIADGAERDPEEIRESVQKTVAGGINLGYIQSKYGKYFITPIDLAAVEDEVKREEEEYAGRMKGGRGRPPARRRPRRRTSGQKAQKRDIN